MDDMIEFAPVVGQSFQLAPDLKMVLAPNASPMTQMGTNTFILGRETLVIIDPGPLNDQHLAALLGACGDKSVSHILVTHSHLDHSPLAAPLSKRTGAPVYAFGNSNAGRSKVMQSLAAAGMEDGGEGIDHSFQPDHILGDSEVVAGDWGELTTIHTPGHLGNHLCFQWGKAIFTGDHVMGWASSLVSPPDGDLTDFMASCARLADYDAQVYYPAHGAPVYDPRSRLSWLINHRKSREVQILQALEDRALTPAQLTQIIYHDTPQSLLGAAERNVFAHLVDLYGRGKVHAQGSLSAGAVFAKMEPERSF